MEGSRLNLESFTYEVLGITLIKCNNTATATIIIVVVVAAAITNISVKFVLVKS